MIGCDPVARGGFEVIAYVLKSNGIHESIGTSAGQGWNDICLRGLLAVFGSEKGAPNP